MNTTADLSILTLIANASLVVKAVLAILIVLSLASWTVIFQKFFVVRRAMRQTDDFESRFWSGTELTKLLDTANRSRDTSGMEERIFAAGMNEFMKQRQTAGAADTVNSVSRAMRAVFTREMDRLENGLPMLASIGSTSPYIGLFGTVWGIMNAFTGLSSLENASLAVVAPGIAEALVATAIGLFAAIPAVAAYNTTALAVSPTALTASAKNSSTFSSANRADSGGTLNGSQQQKPPPRPDGRDQRRSLHRRDARARRHPDGCRPLCESERRQPAIRQQSVEST